MIIDYFYPNRDGDELPHLYERTRGEDKIVKTRTITPEDPEYQLPFCWVPVHCKQEKRISARYPRTDFWLNKQAIGIDGTKLMKMTTQNPHDLWNIKEEIQNSGGTTYEADIQYVDQYLIKQYPNKIPNFIPRIWYFDLEWDIEEGFTTVMAVCDSFSKHPVVFAWNEEKAALLEQGLPSFTEEWIDREGGYLLKLYGSEGAMHEGFLQYLDECDPDILTAHWISGADLPHLMERLEDPDRLSPINQVDRPSRIHGKYKETQQPIRGRLVFDTAARGLASGSGFESIWQKSGRGQMSSRKLDWVAKELDLGEKLTNRIEGMTVRNGWRDYFDEFVDYCLVDATLLRDIDNKLHAIEFFVAMQQLCGVSFASTHKVSRYFRGLIGRRTELKAPSSRPQTRVDLQAAYIPDPKWGRYENVALLDFASWYPNIILSLNLSWETKRQAGGEGIKSIGNGTHWDQTKEGLLPSVVREMLTLRKEYKALMEAAKTPDDRMGYDMLQTATKVAVNALYGMVSMHKIGGMWSDLDIGSTITYKGREGIRLLLTESEEMGYKSLYGHTDSAFVQVPFDEAKELAIKLTKKGQKELNMPHLDVELEAYFDYWVSAKVKNRIFGIKSWPESEKGQMKVTGFELKAANAAPISKKVQKIAFQLIGAGAEEEEVSNALRPVATQLRNGEIPKEELAPFGRIKRNLSTYGKKNIDGRTSTTPNVVQAARFYNKHIATEDPFNAGDGAQWVYVRNEESKVIAFRDPSEIEKYELDYDIMVTKLIKAKLESVYDIMGWDIKVAAGAPIPKVYW